MAFSKAFHEMAKDRDDTLLDGYTPTSWDDEEWEWKERDSRYILFMQIQLTAEN